MTANCSKTAKSTLITLDSDNRIPDETPYYLVNISTHEVIHIYQYSQRAAARRRRDELNALHGAARFVLQFATPRGL